MWTKMSASTAAQTMKDRPSTPAGSTGIFHIMKPSSISSISTRYVSGVCSTVPV